MASAAAAAASKAVIVSEERLGRQAAELERLHEENLALRQEVQVACSASGIKIGQMSARIVELEQ